MGSDLSRGLVADLTSKNLEVGSREIHALCTHPDANKVKRYLQDVVKIRVENEIAVDCAEIAKIIGNFPRLKHVVIKGNELSGAQTEKIITAICSKKFSLIDFSGNRVSLQAAKILRTMMAAGKVKRLQLRSCKMDRKKLCEILQGYRLSRSKVKTLDICGNSITKGVYDEYQDLFLHQTIIWDRKIRESSWKKAKRGVAKSVTTLIE